MANELFQNEKLYSKKQVLPVVNIGLTTFNTLVDNGIIPVVRISERIHRFKGSTLNRVFSEQKKYDV